MLKEREKSLRNLQKNAAGVDGRNKDDDLTIYHHLSIIVSAPSGTLYLVNVLLQKKNPQEFKENGLVNQLKEYLSNYQSNDTISESRFSLGSMHP